MALDITATAPALFRVLFFFTNIMLIEAEKKVCLIQAWDPFIRMVSVNAQFETSVKTDFGCFSSNIATKCC